MLLTLPQETVNEVIGYLREEGSALRSLSTVAKRFTEECRRHLFASIHIDSEEKVARWCDTIPPGEDRLSRHVRFLYVDTWSGGSTCISILRGHPAHLRSFTQVKHLSICPLNLTEFSNQDLVHCFGHFSTVRSICIQPTGGHSSILSFLAAFPLLETTRITYPLVLQGEPEDVNLPNLVCRGDLILSNLMSDNCNSEILFSCLTRPTTCYRMLRLEFVKVDNPASLERFFEVCSGSLESFQFIHCFFGRLVHCPDTLLSPLTELRDVALSLLFSDDHFNAPTILSSITSTKVTSVTLFIWQCPLPNGLNDFSLRWMEIENALCRLTELKRGTGFVPEIVLDVHFDHKQVANEVSRLLERGEFMPRFQKGGVVNVILSTVPEMFS